MNTAGLNGGGYMGTGKQPYYISAADGSVLSIAGLCDQWKDTETREPMRSCTMIVTAANAFTRVIHDRMPVLLDPPPRRALAERRRGHRIAEPGTGGCAADVAGVATGEPAGRRRRSGVDRGN